MVRREQIIELFINMIIFMLCYVICFILYYYFNKFNMFSNLDDIVEKYYNSTKLLTPEDVRNIGALSLYNIIIFTFIELLI
jgi:hypothetical protein